MKSILLLAALAAATLAADQPELTAGTVLTQVPDDIADKLITEGKAQITEGAESATASSPPATPPRKSLIKARVLLDGQHGKVNDVVSVTAAAAKASSELDASPEAVAYAESLAS